MLLQPESVPVSDASRDAVVRPRWWELAVLAVVTAAALCGVVAYYDNAHRATTNGLAKSIVVRTWVERLPTRTTDADNMLYYPVVGAIVRALPARLFGEVWQRMAYVNAFLGGLVLALTYLICVRLFRSRATALFACACQLAMAFFLLLSTINEDIMPGYIWFVAAVACAVSARRLTPWVIVLTAQCVAMSWLFHASLRLPSIAAFVLAIAAVEDTWTQRVRSVALFIIALLPVPIVSALAFGLPWWNGVWSFKGFGTSWGGFALNKVPLMAGAIAQSIWGGHIVASVEQLLAMPLVITTAATLLVAAALFAVWVVQGWHRRAAPEWRMAAVVVTSVFILGEAMNLYIQPQDPQWQIQPMMWFPFAAACVFWVAGRLARGAAIARVGLAGLAAMLFVANLRAHDATRHADSVALTSIREIESFVRPERTMFLLHGFEGMSHWLTVSWGPGTEWPASQIPPSGTRGFHAIYIGGEITLFPAHSVPEAADLVTFAVDVAFDLGYDVVAMDIWGASESQWVDSFVTVSGPEKPLAMRAALRERFVGERIRQIPGWGTLYRITRKAP